MLTRDDTFINKSDMLKSLEQIAPAVDDASLRQAQLTQVGQQGLNSFHIRYIACQFIVPGGTPDRLLL